MKSQPRKPRHLSTRPKYDGLGYILSRRQAASPRIRQSHLLIEKLPRRRIRVCIPGWPTLVGPQKNLEALLAALVKK